jgi:hypothetical protein
VPSGPSAATEQSGTELGSDEIGLRDRVGWVTRTEIISLIDGWFVAGPSTDVVGVELVEQRDDHLRGSGAAGGLGDQVGESSGAKLGAAGGKAAQVALSPESSTFPRRQWRPTAVATGGGAGFSASRPVGRRDSR